MYLFQTKLGEEKTTGTLLQGARVGKQVKVTYRQAHSGDWMVWSIEQR